MAKLTALDMSIYGRSTINASARARRRPPGSPAPQSRRLNTVWRWRSAPDSDGKLRRSTAANTGTFTGKSSPDITERARSTILNTQPAEVTEQSLASSEPVSPASVGRRRRARRWQEVHPARRARPHGRRRLPTDSAISCRDGHPRARVVLVVEAVWRWLHT